MGVSAADGKLLSFDYSAAGFEVHGCADTAAEPELVFVVKGPAKSRVAKALSGQKNATLET